MNTEEIKLTHEIHSICQGKSLADVVSAAMNIVITALDSVDAPEMRSHFTQALRDMADFIEASNTKSIH